MQQWQSLNRIPHSSDLQASFPSAFIYVFPFRSKIPKTKFFLLLF